MRFWQRGLRRVVLIAALCSGTRALAAPGATVVLTWNAGARSAVSVTMDDGYANQWRYIGPLLTSRGFAGTFFLVTDWIDAENLWPPWQAMAAAGHEIGSHGLTHVSLVGLDAITLDAELSDSRKRIQQMIGPTHGLSLGYPFSDSSSPLAQVVQASGYLAARTGGDTLNTDTPDLFLIQSRHPLAATPLTTITGWIDEARTQGGWLVLGVHGVYDPQNRFPATQEGWEPLPLDRYVSVVDHLAAAGSDLWVAPLGEVARHVRARNAARAKVLEANRTVIRVELAGPTGGPVLTCETEVPPTWIEVSWNLGVDAPQIVPTELRGAKRVLRFAAAPPTIVTLHPLAVPWPAQPDASAIDTLGDRDTTGRDTVQSPSFPQADAGCCHLGPTAPGEPGSSAALILGVALLLVRRRNVR